MSQEARTCILRRLNCNVFLQSVLVTPGIIHECLNRYNEVHRFYHNLDHIHNLLIEIENENGLSRHQRELLQAIALFHDVIYDPHASDNEINSATFFNDRCKSKLSSKKKSDIVLVFKAICDTCYSPGVNNSDPLYTLFKYFDLIKPLFFNSVTNLIRNEQKIRKEFQWVPFNVYKSKRLEILRKFKQEFAPGSHPKYDDFINYLVQSKMRVGLYAGSFDPFHAGHMNVIEQAEHHFDKVLVLIAVNDKPGSSDLQKRKELVQAILPFHEVDEWVGMIPDYISCLRLRDQDVTLIRGLRNGYDLDYEINMSRFLKDIDPSIKQMYFISDVNTQHLSSSAIRKTTKIWSEFGKRYTPTKYSYYKGSVNG